MAVDADLAQNDTEDPEAIWAEITGSETSDDNKGDEPSPEEVTEDQADTAKVEETSSDDQQTDDEPQTDNDDDPWADAPEHLKTLYEQALATKDEDIKRARARSAGQQRRADELDQRYRELEARLSTEPSTNDDDQSRGQGDDDDPLEALQEDYPDIAKPLIDKIRDTERKIDQLTAAEQRQAQRDAADREAQFMAIHSDGYDVITENQDKFQTFLYDAPGDVREAFEMNRESLVDPESAALVVTEFKKSLGLPATPNPKPENDNLQTKRNRQLRGAQGGGPTKSQTNRRSGAPDPDSEPEKYWDHITQQKAS